MVEVGPLRLVPLALVHGHHLARVAGDAVIGQEIGRVGEDQVHAVAGNGGQNLQATALVNFYVVLRIVKDRLGQQASDIGDVGLSFCHGLWRCQSAPIRILDRQGLVVKLIHRW